MNLEQCWQIFLKAESLTEQGHWPEAFHLYDQVLASLPEHLTNAVSDQQTPPCQLVCIIRGLRDATVHQSEILNKMGQQKCAFDLLNQTYAQLQFLALEPSPKIEKLQRVLAMHSEELFTHISAFCIAQRNASWQMELSSIEKAHQSFTQLKSPSAHSQVSYSLN